MEKRKDGNSKNFPLVFAYGFCGSLKWNESTPKGNVFKTNGEEYVKSEAAKLRDVYNANPQATGVPVHILVSELATEADLVQFVNAKDDEVG